jgi:hypothetical protein
MTVVVIFHHETELRASFQPRLDLFAAPRLLIDPPEKLFMLLDHVLVPGEWQPREPHELAVKLMEIDDLDLKERTKHVEEGDLRLEPAGGGEDRLLTDFPALSHVP